MNKKVNIFRKIFRSLIGVVIITGLNPVQSSFASDNDIPVEMQVTIFLKSIAYNKSLSNSSNKINIGVISNPSSNKSLSNKESFIEIFNVSKNSISDKSFNIININSNDLSEMKKQGLDILYLTHGITSLDGISRFARDNKVLTWSSDPDQVRNGNASMSVITKNNRPKVFVNLKNTKLEGQDISSQLLKLSEIVD